MDRSKAPRINRYLASAGVASRRACDELVESGRVRVNGAVVTDHSTRIGASDDVTVDGEPVNPARTLVYLASHKPAGVVTTNADDRGRKRAVDFLKSLYGGRLFSIGRLDVPSTGLLLFTNDGDACHRLTHPSAQVEREYLVETKRPIPKEHLDAFAAGIRIHGSLYRARRYRLHTARRCSIVLTEGKNREIRNVFAHFKLSVTRIHRVRYGPVSIGRLPVGQARFLTDREQNDIRVLVQKGGPHGRRDRRSRGHRKEQR